MLNRIIAIVILLGVTMSASFASQTAIRSYSGNPVQCNKWGWVYDNYQTVWGNPCTPLEVQSADGSKVFTVASTDGQCGENQYAVYEFNEGDDDIAFTGCFGISKNDLKTNIKK